MKPTLLRILGVTALSVTLFIPGAIATDGSCDGVGKRQRLTKLGGPNAFGSATETVPDLQRAFETHRDDIVFLLETQGLIDAVPAVFEAVRNGEVVDRELRRGETFEWMAFRWQGKPKLTDNLCVDTTEDYAAFEITVTLGEQPAPAQCHVSASASCDFQNEQAMVDASGSSAGVSVAMSNGSSSTTILADAGSGTSWQGALDDPYRSTYTFTAEAGEGPEQAVRQITLVVPKVCMNIALIADEEVMVSAPGCSDSASLSCPVTTPSCSIASSNSNPWTREPTNIEVSGDWPGNQIAVEVQDAEGMTAMDPQIAGPFPAEASFSKPGSYTLLGTATNEIGETATCSTNVDVDGRWTLRPLFHYADPSSDRAHTEAPAPAPYLQQRGSLHADSGTGLELGLEYHVNDRIGVEGKLSYSTFDALFMFDIDDIWEMDDANFSVTSFTIGPDIHLMPEAKLDLFLTPFLGFSSLDGVDFNLIGVHTDVDFDSQFTWGVALGLDVPLGSATPWNLSFSARYMDLDADDRQYKIGLDPLFLGAGVAYDF